MASSLLSDGILKGLNAAQSIAVASPASVLQILAPPGSGKTKALTARAAWLLHHCGYKPTNIIVATFTVKAAKEMKERLAHMLPDGVEAKLILGTFHSIARRYLVRYGHLIGIKSGFGIADTADSLAIVKRILKRVRSSLDPSTARNRISNLKAQGISHSDHIRSLKKTEHAQEFAQVYGEYEDALKRSNTLDYDDLLVRCVELLQKFPSCVSNVEAVLIDEFQDTNMVQFELMKLFASRRRRITIVGDPDQSIYGFRHAEVKNLERMRQYYENTETVHLEENYRSSGSILLSALELIQQDETRPAKALLPTHCVGTQPVLRSFASPEAEAFWIVQEIQRVRAMTGNLFALGDFAILLRSASLSRHIELALGKSGMPYKMIGGNRFFDRLEVKILLDYLRTISQPDHSDALARIINIPPRRIGEATIKYLLEEADSKKVSVWSRITAHSHGICTDTRITKAAAKALGNFQSLINNLRAKLGSLDNAASSLTEMIGALMEQLDFHNYLKRSHPEDHENRWANVQELISQACDFSTRAENGQIDDEVLPVIDGLDQQNSSAGTLSSFLANLALSSESSSRAARDGQPQDQVTISTIHSAKGLEWPAVFIPGAFEGSIPHSRATNIDEERRLLYVAMTRAQGLLYISFPEESSQRLNTSISSFLSRRSLKPHLTDKVPSLGYDTAQSLSRILGRQCPSEAGIARTLQEARNSEEIVSDSENGYHATERHPKRRCLGPERTNVHGRTSTLYSRPGNTMLTTMNNPAAFSVASTTMNQGFVSAGAHLRQLGEKELNDTKRGKIQTARQRVGGQIEIAPMKPSVTDKSMDPKQAVDGKSTQRQVCSEATSKFIDPFRHAHLRPYMFLSSSPPPVENEPGQENAEAELPQSTEACSHSAKAGSPISISSSPPPIQKHPGRPRADSCASQSTGKCTALVKKADKVEAPRESSSGAGSGLRGQQPAMSRPSGKRTLGVRRSMNGWANRAR